MSDLTATIKTHPEDFIVNEILDFSLTGDGEHLWCYVEKRGMNTAFLKREWSRLLNYPAKFISHSGLKDRHAVTRQWLCLLAREAENLPEQGEGWQIIERSLHQKKLRIGSHRRNEFHITLRQVSGDRAEIEQRLTQVANIGFANAFGLQRFGQRNLINTKQWVERGGLPKKRDERAQTLSTLRSHLFNLELSARQKHGNAHQLISGDFAMLIGSNSHFMVEEVDETLNARCAQGDIAPAGLLYGKAKQALFGAAQAIREEAYRDEKATLDYLEKHCTQDCRPLVVRPTDFRYQWVDDSTLSLSFFLPRGSFATTLISTVFDSINDASAPSIEA